MQEDTGRMLGQLYDPYANEWAWNRQKIKKTGQILAFVFVSAIQRKALLKSMKQSARLTNKPVNNRTFYS